LLPALGSIGGVLLVPPWLPPAAELLLPPLLRPALLPWLLVVVLSSSSLPRCSSGANAWPSQAVKTAQVTTSDAIVGI
jgi:hypothetical protein